ncbi:DUF2259 domain-containing protein [Rhizobium sp. LjRoot30]|uniref:DUF2259 domain-containing protein n=1 Tax=Rhizobium sp. LjRoot30 TaxID=3342320 RepID=UPI003ECEB349
MRGRRRIAAWLIAALAFGTGAASAGDFANIQPLGFSADGGVFAFEEYGVQDGSGFPYATIYFIDTKEDRYLPGTPYRVRLEDEQASLGKARGDARRAAAKLIETYDLASNPGLLAAFNPFTELDTVSDKLRYDAVAVQPPVGNTNTMVLETFDLQASPKCQSFDAKTRGFRLRLKEIEGQPANRLFYEDKQIPESRNCPTEYRLGGVMTFSPQPAGGWVHIALVLVLSQGFEGSDGRWIAVPVRP